MSWPASMWGTPIERFIEKIAFPQDPTTECWQWIGGKKKAGYGQFSVRGKKVIAHRFSFSHFVGPIPEGYEVDHVCRNRSCVNPSPLHLEAVPLRVNRQRRDAPRTGCKYGHPYTSATPTWTDKNGHTTRLCRACRAATSKRANAK